MPISKLLLVVAFVLTSTSMLYAQSLTRDIIKYNFAESTFDTLAGVPFELTASEATTNFHFGEMDPTSVPLDQPTINLSEGTNFTKPLVAKEHYSMEEYPMSTTIKLFKTTGTDELRDQCTGTMVSPRHVLTSAHCLLKPYSTDVVVDNLVTYAGYDVSMDSTKHIKAMVTNAYFIDEWNIGKGDDQALLELDENLGFYTGWVSFGFNEDDEFFKTRNFHKFSYPTYTTPYNSFPFNGDTLYYSYGALDHVADDFLGVIGHIKGAGGESGSSILYTNNEDIYTSYGVLTWVGYYNHSRFNAERYYAMESIISKSLLTSTQQLDQGIQVNLYPNPAENQLQINLDKSVNLSRATLIDNSGRILSKYYPKEDGFSISVSHLSSGLYHLSLVTDEGTFTTKSFIKS